MIFLFIDSILLPLIIGFAVVSLLWPNQRLLSDLAIKLFFAVGIGFGITSCTFFLWLGIGKSLGLNVAVIEVMLALSLLAVLYKRTRSGQISRSVESWSSVTASLKLHRFFSIAFNVSVICAVITCLAVAARIPHGRWDGWVIWNMRAKAIFKMGDGWRNAFTNYFFHPDYPLLLPLNVARSWTYVGHETVIVPVIISTLFMLATVGLIYSSLSILRSKAQAILAGLILLGTPFFVMRGAAQEADLPLAFFFLATLAIFHFQDRLKSGGHNNLLILAGAMAGLAAWTKNEGLLFLLVVIVARFIAVVPTQGWRTYFKQMLFFSLGLVPVLVPVIFFKETLATANDLVASQNAQSTLERLTDISRYIKIFKSTLSFGFRFGEWTINPLLLLLVYPALIGVKFPKHERPSIITSAIVLTLMMAGYILAYLTTPHKLNWHIDTSYNRLFMQLFPSFLLLYFSLVQTPEEALMNKAELDSVNP